MTKYEAIMKAADFIERNPDRYRYMATNTPGSDGGCQACMWGWTGHFMEMPAGMRVTEVAQFLGEVETDLYMIGWKRANGDTIKSRGFSPDDSETDRYGKYISSPANAVIVMREYAERFAPETKAEPACQRFIASLRELTGEAA